MPIKKYLLLCALSICATSSTRQEPKMRIVLDTAGDTAHPGRNIDDQFERTISFQCAQAIKRKLEHQLKYVEIFFSRLPGEQVSQQEKALCANQLPANFYLTLHVYKTKQLKPQIHVYYYNNASTTSAPSHVFNFDTAHLMHHTDTRNYASVLARELRSKQMHGYDLHDPIGIPCLPCKGIIAPAICIEIGIRTSDWACCLEPLVHGLSVVCKTAIS